MSGAPVHRPRTVVGGPRTDPWLACGGQTLREHARGSSHGRAMEDHRGAPGVVGPALAAHALQHQIQVVHDHPGAGVFAQRSKARLRVSWPGVVCGG